MLYGSLLTSTLFSESSWEVAQGPLISSLFIYLCASLYLFVFYTWDLLYIYMWVLQKPYVVWRYQGQVSSIVIIIIFLIQPWESKTIINNY